MDSVASSPLVSVIIVTFKRPDNLGNALRSVLEQTYPNIELIVVDDNDEQSAERKLTEAVMEHFPSVIYLKHATNKNGAAARNTGIANAQGIYLSFLDDDDIYYPGKIEKSVEAILQYDDSFGAVYCGYTGWRSKENDPSRYKEGDLTFELLALKYDTHYLHTNTMLYKSEALRAIGGYDEGFVRHQDLELNIRFFQHYKTGVVKEIGVEINPFPVSTTNYAKDEALYNIKKRFLDKFEPIIRQFGEKEQEEIYFRNWEEAMFTFSTSEEFCEFAMKQPGREDLKFANAELVRTHISRAVLESVQSGFTDQLTAKDERIRELELANTELNGQLNLKSERISELEDTRNTSENKLTGKETYISELETARQLLNGIIDEKSAYISALETSSTEMKALIEQLTSDLQLQQQQSDHYRQLLEAEKEALIRADAKIKEISSFSVLQFLRYKRTNTL